MTLRKDLSQIKFFKIVNFATLLMYILYKNLSHYVKCYSTFFQKKLQYLLGLIVQYLFL